MNRSNLGASVIGFGQGGYGGNFYNQQVHKPIRGGGGGAIDRSSQAINFSEFMDKNQNYSSNKNRTTTQKQVLN